MYTSFAKLHNETIVQYSRDLYSTGTVRTSTVYLRSLILQCINEGKSGSAVVRDGLGVEMRGTIIIGPLDENDGGRIYCISVHDNLVNVYRKRIELSCKNVSQKSVQRVGK